MNIVIAGSRKHQDKKKFTNYQLVKAECIKAITEVNQKIAFSLDDIQVISGHCKEGADVLGEQFAVDLGLKLKLFPAKWDDLNTIPCRVSYDNNNNPYNRLAGINRNHQMIDYCVKYPPAILIVFWNGKSTGTKDIIDYAKKYSICTKVIII
jgi:hypothetical protein